MPWRVEKLWAQALVSVARFLLRISGFSCFACRLLRRFGAVQVGLACGLAISKRGGVGRL